MPSERGADMRPRSDLARPTASSRGAVRWLVEGVACACALATAQCGKSENEAPRGGLDAGGDASVVEAGASADTSTTSGDAAPDTSLPDGETLHTTMARDAVASNADATLTDGSIADATPSGDAEEDAAFDADAAFEAAAFDPQPSSCDAGGIPPQVGGTLECPGDKNLPGCPCPTPGATAPCWTGQRADRGHGNCRDGTTKCSSAGGELTWGTCDGEVLPVPGSPSGTKAACGCFTTGQWQVDNLSPCFLTMTDGLGASTTTMYASTPGVPATCPLDSSTGAPAIPQSWSTDTLTVDCAGSYSLCYTLKAGNAKQPQPSDCVIASVCTPPTRYTTPGAPQVFPPLPGWQAPASASACIDSFMQSGGYGVMSVQGQSDECAFVSRDFRIISYCASSCNSPTPPASCATCQNTGANF
jgi:hypothetical protein